MTMIELSAQSAEGADADSTDRQTSRHLKTPFDSAVMMLSPQQSSTPLVPDELMQRKARSRQFDLLDKLARQQACNHSLLDCAHGGAWLIGTDARLIAVNATYARDAGLLSPEDAIGRKLHDIWPSELADDMWGANRSVIASGQPLRYERNMPIAGCERIIAISLSPVICDESVIGVAGLAYDISDFRQAIGALRERQVQLLNLAENSPDNIVRFDERGRVTYINPAYERSMQIRSEAVVGKVLSEVFPPESPDLKRFLDLVRTVIATGKATDLEIQVPDPNSNLRTHHILLTAERSHTGKILGALAIGRDVTERCEMEERLAEREREFRTLAENSPDAIIRYDYGLRRLYVNPVAVSIAGSSFSYSQGLTPDDGTPVLSVELYKAVLREVFESGQAREAEIQVKAASGVSTFNTRAVPEFGEMGRVQSVLAISRDITASVQQRARIERLAFSDPLTGLANRALFHDRAREQLELLSSQQYGVGLMLLDIDHFKDVNDTLGHSSGDELLKEISERLSACVRDTDTLARLGGDEFVILLANIETKAEVENVVVRIQRKMAPVFRINEEELFVSSSIGIAVTMDRDCGIDELMASADEALYEAKRNGRNNARFYRPDLSRQTLAKVALSQALRQALGNSEFNLLFQPKCRLSDGHLTGAEALIRWNHPTLGVLSPDRFISIAEDTGHIIDIGRWVLGEACATVVRLNSSRTDPITMAVNISPRQVVSGVLVEDIANALATSGCRPSWLEIEITEGMMLRDSKCVQETLSAISDMGVTIAIDDFGTGHSALAYLDRFPVNVLKIDRSFIMKMGQDRRKAAIVQAFISLAEAMDLRVVAEGVETAEQAIMLCQYGCELGQGYFYGKPMSVEALAGRYSFCHGV